MVSKTIRFLTAATLILSSTMVSAASAPLAPAVEPAPAGQSQLDGNMNGGVWFGAIFSLATLLVIIFHDELFDDDDEEPVST